MKTLLRKIQQWIEGILCHDTIENLGLLAQASAQGHQNHSALLVRMTEALVVTHNRLAETRTIVEEQKLQIAALQRSALVLAAGLDRLAGNELSPEGEEMLNSRNIGKAVAS
jgi:hypothetical protein